MYIARCFILNLIYLSLLIELYVKIFRLITDKNKKKQLIGIKNYKYTLRIVIQIFVQLLKKFNHFEAFCDRSVGIYVDSSQCFYRNVLLVSKKCLFPALEL